MIDVFRGMTDHGDDNETSSEEEEAYVPEGNIANFYKYYQSSRNNTSDGRLSGEASGNVEAYPLVQSVRLAFLPAVQEGMHPTSSVDGFDVLGRLACECLRRWRIGDDAGMKGYMIRRWRLLATIEEIQKACEVVGDTH